MSPILATITAFAARACPPKQRKSYLLYSALLTLGLVGLGFWLVSAAHADQLYNQENGYLDYYYSENTTIYLWSVTTHSIFEMADILSMILLSLGGFVILPAVVASVVGSECKTGTMDQLRATPSQALHLLAGFIFGAPLRLYLLLAGPLLLHLSVGLLGIVPLSTVLLSTLVFVVGATASAIVGAVFALAPQAGSSFSGNYLVAVISGILLLVTIAFGSDTEVAGWAFVHPGGAVNSMYLGDSLMWRHWILDPWDLERLALEAGLWSQALLAIAFTGSSGAVLLSAAKRRIAKPDTPLLSPLEAFLLFAIASSVLIFAGPEWNREVLLATGVVLLPLVALFVLATQPNARVWALSVRSQANPSAPWGTTLGMVGFFCAAVGGKIVITTAPITEVITYCNSYDSYLCESPSYLGSFVWLLVVALSIPALCQFAAARFGRTSHRMAFSVAGAVHLLFQMICIVGLPHNHGTGIIPIGMLFAVAVPAVIIWRTAVFRKQVLSK